MDSDGQMSIFNEENEKEETKIKLSPGDQAMIDDMDRPIDWERAERGMKLMKAHLRYMEEKNKIKEEPKIKLSPGDQAMIDYMDKPIDWERANRIAKLMEARFEELERKKEAQQEK